jgi:20S proteasome alpha/beta subunit
MNPKPQGSCLFDHKKRLPVRRRAVTFIVGMKCSDGLVLAADSLESDGVTRRYRTKLETVDVGSEWGISWGGSGSASVVDKFSDKFKQMIGSGSFNRHTTELSAEACLDFIRTQYTAKEQITIVMGMHGRPMQKDHYGEPYLGVNEFHLYRGFSENACLSPEKEYCCAGMDVTLAEFILANSYFRFMTVVEGVRLSVLATALMKKYAEGVGGPTDVRVFSYGNQIWNPLLDRELKDIEDKFPVGDVEDNFAKFWADHPHRINFSEMNQAQIDKEKALRLMIPPRPMRSIVRKAKLEP